MKTGIYDNPRFIDRYTLITKEGSLYGFNDFPFQPWGFGQYCGKWTGGSRRHLGKKILLPQLSEEAQKFINQRIGT